MEAAVLELVAPRVARAQVEAARHARDGVAAEAVAGRVAPREVKARRPDAAEDATGHGLAM